MHLFHHFGEIDRGRRIKKTKVLKYSYRMDRSGDIIEGTNGHAAKIEALAAYTAMLNKPDLFSSRSEPD
jgi:hypothetical protein